MCKTIEEGQKSFRDQMKKLREGIDKLTEDTKTSTEFMQEILKGIKAVENYFNSLPKSDVSFIVDKKNEIKESIEVLKNIQNQFIESHENDTDLMNTFYDLKDEIMEDINRFHDEYKILLTISDPENLEKEINDYEKDYHRFVRNQDFIRNRKAEKLGLLNNLKTHYSNFEATVLSLPLDQQERFKQSLLEERLIILFYLNSNTDSEV